MKKNKLSEAKTIAMLNEAEAGVPVTDICRKACREKIAA